MLIITLHKTQNITFKNGPIVVWNDSTRQKILWPCPSTIVWTQGANLFENFVKQFSVHSSWGWGWYMILHCKNCYTSWNLWSKMSKMQSILLRDTVEFAPCVNVKQQQAVAKSVPSIKVNILPIFDNMARMLLYSHNSTRQVYLQVDTKPPNLIYSSNCSMTTMNISILWLQDFHQRTYRVMLWLHVWAQIHILLLQWHATMIQTSCPWSLWSFLRHSARKQSE